MTQSFPFLAIQGVSTSSQTIQGVELGDAVEASVGATLGIEVGELLGAIVGTAVGEIVGATVGGLHTVHLHFPSF